MIQKKPDRPIFFIGSPRSGTTLVFEVFAKHPDVSWLMNYNDFFPNTFFINSIIPIINNKYLHLIGEKQQYNRTSLLNKYLPKPDECYRFWATHTPDINFSRDFLLNKKATDKTKKRLNNIFYDINRYQKKKRITTKLTGPGRISYLDSIFSDAIFIHLVRDGRSVVQSLMNVEFWKNKVKEPWFINGLEEVDLNIWEENDKDPVILTTLLWNKIIETTKNEANNLNNKDKRYLEIKYEDFINNPSQVLKEMYTFTDLETTDKIIDNSLKGSNILSNMNKKFVSHFSEEKQNKINNILFKNLQEFNYL